MRLCDISKHKTKLPEGHSKQTYRIVPSLWPEQCPLLVPPPLINFFFINIPFRVWSCPPFTGRYVVLSNNSTTTQKTEEREREREQVVKQTADNRTRFCYCLFLVGTTTTARNCFHAPCLLQRELWWREALSRPLPLLWKSRCCSPTRLHCPIRRRRRPLANRSRRQHHQQALFDKINSKFSAQSRRWCPNETSCLLLSTIMQLAW